MRKFLLLATAAIGLSGCALNTSNALLTKLTNLANTATGDLQSAVLVANAATPPDADGATCAAAGLTVVKQMQAVLSALPSGATVGAFTVAEVASLYAPGSAQANEVVKTIETGCIAKLHDINQTGVAAAGVFATLLGIVTAGA